MAGLIDGARKLPLHHITIRVPWHDSGWDGTVCKEPAANTSCLALKRIGAEKNDAGEIPCRGKKLADITDEEHPPCISERVSFMAKSEIRRKMIHPYVEKGSEQHQCIVHTPFIQPAYSAACVPFRWMLAGNVEGEAEKKKTDEDEGRSGGGLMDRYQLGYEVQREPTKLFGKKERTIWVQERTNQLIMLDTFFSAVKPEESLCFFYAKKTPLSEQGGRVIIGVGRVKAVGEPTEYKYNTDRPSLRCVLWERNVVHSIRPKFEDGFLFPYQEVFELAQREEGINPEDYVAFAPDEYFDAFSYGSELLTHGGAISALLSCEAALRKIKEVVSGPWDQAIQWIDRELNRLWKARGPFPGLGSALKATGFEHGSLMAYEIASAQENAKKEWSENPWDLVDAVVEDPSLLGGLFAETIGDTMREKWKGMKPERRALLKLLSRCELTEDQAARMFVAAEREEAGIELQDRQIIENPYLIYERDRYSADAIAFETVDRGLFPDAVVRERFPVPEPSGVKEAIDPRRVRAVMLDTLEKACSGGHTLLPQNQLITAVRDRALQPPCPLDEDVMSMMEGKLEPIVYKVPVEGGRDAFQNDRMKETRDIISKCVQSRVFKGKRHAGTHDWAKMVERGIGEKLPEEKTERELEKRAREEKAAALAEVFASRLSVLLGPAGTGKTTLLKVLCGIKEIEEGGVLLLAPTGKARVRLERATGLEGGMTIAQFLIGYGRYDGDTGRYFPKAKAPKCQGFKTVIIDESSMLTEEQLAAVIDALAGVSRLVLVGDHRQLPPIGAGRPFVDIVRKLAPEHVESRFPRIGTGYAELTVQRRQKGAVRDDLLLASEFAGSASDPGVDDVWDRIESNESESLRLVRWDSSEELQQKLVAELVTALKLSGPDDSQGFEKSLGGSVFEGKVYFWAGKKNSPGAARCCEDWQVLSPVRAAQHGVDAVNRALQERFRSQAMEMATRDRWRKIPPPFGSQRILWGDKVINVVNKRNRRVFPSDNGESYVANGDIGIVVGVYKTKRMKRTPRNLEVEFLGQEGKHYKYWPSEFGEEGSPPLELAYALTVHKTQGSEFKITFVVLPNPCWLLSRELLYTALTRHQDRLVILHQGPFRELRRYSVPRESDIARRMTNLMDEPSPVLIEVGKKKTFYEERLIHRTERGDLVRSKGEVIIADKLYARGFTDYLYEQELLLPNGTKRYPDFTVSNDATGVTYYWEHLGMLGDPGYRARWERKKKEYLDAGILPYQEGGGEMGTLIETADRPDGGIDAAEIARIIDEVINA